MAAHASHAAFEGSVAEAVIGRPPLRVFQRLIGFVDFLEAFLGGAVAIAAVGVALLGETAKGGLDLLIGSRSPYTQYVVIVSLRHAPHPAFRTNPPTSWRRLASCLGLAARGCTWNRASLTPTPTVLLMLTSCCRRP